jgi:hypothetical protein
VLDILFYTILENLEILFSQIRNVSPILVKDQTRDRNQACVDLQPIILLTECRPAVHEHDDYRSQVTKDKE